MSYQMRMKSDLSTTETIICEARAGRMFILIDDENRENEGDLILPAAAVKPEHINFMATYGRGLICLAMDAKNVDRLSLPLMSKDNDCQLKTAFTISIDARYGITTGISAADRARTIQVASNPQSTRTDICAPGHIFPLRANEGGVLTRAGHTEASVEISKLAGFTGAAVICEIMNKDGSMARLSDLIKFAKSHDLKIGTIADLIQFLQPHPHSQEAHA